MIMEYCVAIEDDVEPKPVWTPSYPWSNREDNNMPLINKFLWGNWEQRYGTIDGHEGHYHFPTTGPLAVVSLRLTCRQFYHELEGVFYRVNTFMFSSARACEDYLAAITAQRRRQIRSISLDLSFSGTRKLLTQLTGPDGFEETCLFTRERHPIAKLLRVNCPFLEQLTVCLGERAESLSIHLQRQRSKPPREFEYEHSRLLFEQCNRNPARVYGEMAGYFEAIEQAITVVTEEDSPLSHPKLEFFIGGSPTMFARVDGRPIHRSTANAPEYILGFQDKLEEANKKMQGFHQLWPDPQTDELLSDPRNYGLLLEESTRMQQGPLPDFKDFHAATYPAGLRRRAAGVVTNAPRYDVNGLILWQNISDPHVIVDILWKGEEIVVGMVIGSRRDIGFEPVSRYASWAGVSEIRDYFEHLFNPRRRRRRRRQDARYRLRVLMENPSPKDIDAALRATGLLHDDGAPAYLRGQWRSFIDTQDGLIAELLREVDWSNVDDTSH
ncbi:hypothetical protein F5Y07DRAFT_374801 [Xylaria sp. FL0933]|nr:hypothetical protein F5Y07DRAFT_374801 [Xylaria sp. FL0933]